MVAQEPYALRKRIGLTFFALFFTVATAQADPIGGGSVQTWKNGATAATTITIDDNNQPDHAWWVATGNTYDIKFTWFVITDRVQPTPNFFGTWQDFIDLKAAGHDVQSHSVDHTPSGGPLTIEQNYADAITAIETNMPGNDVLTLAYPNGLNPGNGNDKTVAAQHYIGARGVSGIPNRLNSVDYLNVNSISSGNNGFQYPGNNVGAPWADAGQLLTPGNQYYEGWISYHAHTLNATQKSNITGLLDYMTTQPDGFWIDSFTSVSQYAQERDAATLTTQIISADEIQYTLTDTLDDALYYQPITVKVRVDNSWAEVIATQGAATLPVTLIMDGGEQFALINSVPDAGVVSLTLPAVVLSGDYNGDGTVDAADYTVWRDSFGQTGTGLAADGDGSDEIDAGDYTVWVNNFGSSSTSATSIPEPTTAVLCGMFLSLFLGSRR